MSGADGIGNGDCGLYKTGAEKTPVKTLLRAVAADALNAEIIFNAGKAGDVFADGIAEKVAFIWEEDWLPHVPSSILKKYLLAAGYPQPESI